MEQLLFEMDQSGVDRAVVICARIGDNADNNEYVARQAEAYAGRIVAFPDIDSSWSPEYHKPGAAERLAQFADRWKIKGFTHYLKTEPDSWLTSSQGWEFFAAAAERRLIASISGGPPWQPELQKVAESHPDLTIMIHHLGGIRANSSSIESDLGLLVASADLPNILVKASGFYYGSSQEWNFPYQDTIRVFERLYEAFGPDRFCWGSDFPVCGKGRSTYRQSIEILRTHCPFIKADDLGQVLGGTLGELLDSSARASAKNRKLAEDRPNQEAREQ